jgi:putative tricarboxylic transport membrane protein
MEMEFFTAAFFLLLTPQYLGFMLFGTAMGIIFGAIPGLNASIGITLMLPFTYRLTPELGIALLMGIYVGGISGGFIAATLIGIPGTNSSIATCYDAYPLSQRGETTRALGTGMTASFIGTFFSVLLAIVLCNFIARIAVMLGPWEYFSLCTCAISLVIALSDQSLLKGFAGAFIGLLIGCIGVSPIDASFRFTFGSKNLIGGIDLVGMMLGLFAIKLIAANFAKNTQKMPDAGPVKMKGFGIPLSDAKKNLWNIIRSFFIGLWIGFLPGLGGNVSNLVAYGQAKNSSKYPEKFGTGIVDGIWAPETANNATIGGALIPMLSLGIPGDALTALLLGALMVHGIDAGPLLIKTKPLLVYTVFVGALLASIYTLIMQMFSMRIFPKILRAPYHYLYATIIFVCFTGAYSATYTMFNCYAVVAFGLLSLFLSSLGIPIAPLTLGFIIGPLIETNLRKGLTYSQDGFLTFLTRPVSGIILLFAVLTIIYGLFFKGRKQKKTPVDSNED